MWIPRAIVYTTQYNVSQMENGSAEVRDRHWKALRKKTQTKYKTKTQICGSKLSAGVNSPFTPV